MSTSAPVRGRSSLLARSSAASEGPAVAAKPQGAVEAGAKATLAVVLKGYPRLSETFIAREILGLERLGLTLALYSLRRPTDSKTHPVHKEIRAPVTYLPEYLYEAPWRVLRAWWRCRRLSGYRQAWRNFVGDLRRDLTPNRIRRFGQACVLADILPPEQGWIYAHFLHTPASVARYAADMTGRSWSASAHAKDIWTSPDWELREKILHAAWVVTCTASGAAHLKNLAGDHEKVGLLYHGLELDDLPRPPGPRVPRDGRDPRNPCRIVSVGRLVEKKGYDLLLEALSRLPLELHWHLTHIGGGTLSKDLKAQAEALGLGHRITWLGAQAFERVVAEYRTADFFALASRIAPDGDRDGLPNVLMEAQSQELPCLATSVSAIPELIEDGVTGRLVAPDDVVALTRGLAEMIGNPALRAELGAAGRRNLAQRFSAEEGFKSLVRRFPYGQAKPKPAGG